MADGLHVLIPKSYYFSFSITVYSRLIIPKPGNASLLHVVNMWFQLSWTEFFSSMISNNFQDFNTIDYYIMK